VSEATSLEQKDSEFLVRMVSICQYIVCSSLPIEEVTRRLNQEHPTGLSHSWELSDEYPDGSPNPSPCNENPKTHKHYLFEC